MILHHCFLAAIVLCCNVVWASDRPHIIYILADDMGFQDVPWHNKGAVLMPNLNVLAKKGRIMEQHYVQPVCTPTRAALLTGRYPFTIGRQSGVIRPATPTGLTLDVKLLPQILRKEGGYKTHIVGKWHLGFCNIDFTPNRRGFNTFMGFLLGSEDYITHEKSTTLTTGETFTGYDFRKNKNVYNPPAGEYSTYTQGKRAVQLLNAHNPNKPFFLYMSFQAPHSPYQVPRAYYDLYAGVADPNRRAYLGMLTAMDDAVDVIVRKLKEKKMYKNSIIVFSTDNGGTRNIGSNWPLKGFKGTLFEGGIRGPAFIHSRLLEKSGTPYNGLFHVVDWFPTLASAAGVPYPNDLNGVDQWSNLKSTDNDSARTKVVYNLIVSENITASVRDGDYKLILGTNKGNEVIPPSEGTSFQIDSTRKATFYQETANVRANLLFLNLTGQCEPPPLDGPAFDIIDAANEPSPANSAPQTRAFNTPEDIINAGLIIQLYNVKNDPEETTNIADSNPAIVNSLLEFVLSQTPSYVQPDTPAETVAANPANFGGVWSPGWC